MQPCPFSTTYKIQSKILKFGYSEKATKLEKIFHLKFDVTEYQNIQTLTHPPGTLGYILGKN